MCLFIATWQPLHLVLQKHSSPITISHWHMQNMIISDSGQQTESCKAHAFIQKLPNPKRTDFWDKGAVPKCNRGWSFSFSWEEVALPFPSEPHTCPFLHFTSHSSSPRPADVCVQTATHELMAVWEVTECFLNSTQARSLKCWGKAITLWARCNSSQTWHVES